MEKDIIHKKVNQMHHIYLLEDKKDLMDYVKLRKNVNVNLVNNYN